MHSEAGLTYLRAAAVKLEPAEKEDFDMRMLSVMMMRSRMMVVLPLVTTSRIRSKDINKYSAIAISSEQI